MASLRTSLHPVKVTFAPGSDAYDVAAAVIAVLKLDAAPDRVRLLLKPVGGGALVPLDSRKQVEQMEQLVEGASVHVEVEEPPAHSE